MTTRCQQDEVYAAERDVPTGTSFATARQAQHYVDGLCDSWWWERFYWQGPARVEVYFSRRRDMSVNKYERAKDGALIELAVGMRDEKTVLHELAHILAEALFDSHAHDPYFARTYAVLVYCVLGSDAWLALQRGYDRCGVAYLQNEQEERKNAGTSTAQ